MELRDYQRKAVNDILDEVFFLTEPEVTLQAPTGYGKSIVIAELTRQLVEDYRLNVVILTNITKLITQTHNLFNNLGLGHSVIKANFKGSPKKLSSKITIAMQQTLASRKNLEPLCDVLIVDERHISFGSSTMVEIENRLKPDNIIGFSATPIDSKGFKLDGVKIVESESIKSLTDRGFLTPVETYVASFSEKLDFSNVTVGANGDYSEPQLSEIINTDEFNEAVVDNWVSVANGLKTIVFASGIDHAEELKNAFILKGIPARTVHSKINKEENELNFSDHRAGKFKVLVSVSQITTGYDDDEIECGICCRPTKVLRLYLQMVGRIARARDGKHKSLWLDFAQCTSELGFYDDDFNFSITSDNAEDLKTEKESKKLSGIDLYLKDNKKEIGTIARTDVLKHLELKKSSAVRGMVLEELIEVFEALNDFREIIDIGSKIYATLTGTKVPEGTIDFVIEGWEVYFDLTSNRIGTKSLKTMIKNVTKNRKKFTSLHYSAGWLLEQEQKDEGRW